MRVLVTGSRGQLGGDLLPALAAAGHTPLPVDRTSGDLGDGGVAARLLATHRPDAVINCAAYNAVDRAEVESEEAMRVNARAPEMLADACAASRAFLCHVSTDFVFDGLAGRAYVENDPTSPLSAYGRSKLAGEVAVLGRMPEALVVRTAWLFGRDGPNFVLAILARARAGQEIRVVDDQWGNPTWTGHLAPALVRLLDLSAEHRVAGVVHLVNSGEASRWEQARAALDAAGLDGVAVAHTQASLLSTAAPRPRRSTLDAEVWRRLGEPPLPPWQDAVRVYLATQAEAGRPTQSPPRP